MPLASAGLGAGAALGWARALGEFGATIMFAGSLQGVTQTAPIAIYLGFERGGFDDVYGSRRRADRHQCGRAPHGQADRTREAAALRADVTHPLRDFTLDAGVEVEGTLAVIGPSGAGKTTLLRLIAGLERPAAGSVECDGERWSGDGVWVPPERRRVGFVFQDYALFPHMSVRANVAFEARTDVDALLERLRIDHLKAAKPNRLSGGERQRVALARALAIVPRVLLLDEPLAALDPSTRSAVAAELAQVIDAAAVPTVVVTHSYEEAVMFADEVAVMDRGSIVQRGRAADVVEAPASAFVAEFAGINYLKGTAAGTTVGSTAGRR